MSDAVIAIPILAVICSFVGTSIVLTNRSKERLARLKVLEQVLRDPANDNATRQEALRRLEGQPGVPGVWGQWLRSNLVPRRVFGAAAWGLIVIGVLTMAFGSYSDFEVGVGTLGVGLAILALPHVMRELDARSPSRP